MATTRLTDVIYGPLFMPATINRIAETSRLRNSGIVANDAAMQMAANSAGDIVQLPFWNDLSGDSNVSTDDPAQNATPNKIGQGQDTARKVRRNNSWQSADLVAAVYADDPLDVVAQLIANYWSREEQKILGQMLSGVFADPLMAGNVLDVASEDANASGVNLDIEVASNAYALLGEYGQELTGLLVHPTVFYNLKAQSAIDYATDPATGLPMKNRPIWDGLDVVMSSNVPRVAGATSGYKYTSYLFGRGAIAYAEATGAGGPKTPVSVDRDEAAGNGEGVETVWYRRHWLMHPRGIAFDGTPAGASPTNAELATGGNWTRVYDAEMVRMVAVTTNG